MTYIEATDILSNIVYNTDEDLMEESRNEKEENHFICKICKNLNQKIMNTNR